MRREASAARCECERRLSAKAVDAIRTIGVRDAPHIATSRREVLMEERPGNGRANAIDVSATARVEPVANYACNWYYSWAKIVLIAESSFL